MSYQGILGLIWAAQMQGNALAVQALETVWQRKDPFGFMMYREVGAGMMLRGWAWR